MDGRTGGDYRFRLRGQAPPIAKDDFFRTKNGGAILIDKSKLIANDRDPDGDSVVFQFVFNWTFNGGMVEDLGNQIRYTPPTGFRGEDGFYYYMSDVYGFYAYGTVKVRVD